MNERHVFCFGLVYGAASFLQLSAVCNDDGLRWPVHGCSLGVLDGLHDVKAFHDLSEDGVPSVQPRSRHCEARSREFRFRKLVSKEAIHCGLDPRAS